MKIGKLSSVVHNIIIYQDHKTKSAIPLEERQQVSSFHTPRGTSAGAKSHTATGGANNQWNEGVCNQNFKLVTTWTLG